MREKIKSGTIRTGDISTSYLIKESARQPAKNVIVFLHGFPFNKNMWRPQLEALPDAVTGIAIDIRGHGNSTRGHGYLSIDVFAKDLVAFLKGMKVSNIILCGISMGGYIALRAYDLFPELITGLILSDTHGHADDNVAKQKRFDSIQAVLTHGRRPFAIGFIANVFARTSIQAVPEAVELIKSSIRRNSLNTICATLLALAARTDTTDVYKQISIPTLLIRGQEDKITPAVYMQEMKDRIAEATLLEIPDCGHLPNLEASAAFNQAIHSFMSKLAR